MESVQPYIAVLARCAGPVDTAAPGAEIAAVLGRLGVAGARVDVTPVERIERSASGKPNRFVAGR